MIYLTLTKDYDLNCSIICCVISIYVEIWKPNSLNTVKCFNFVALNIRIFFKYDIFAGPSIRGQLIYRLAW